MRNRERGLVLAGAALAVGLAAGCGSDGEQVIHVDNFPPVPTAVSSEAHSFVNVNPTGRPDIRFGGIVVKNTRHPEDSGVLTAANRESTDTGTLDTLGLGGTVYPPVRARVSETGSDVNAVLLPIPGIDALYTPQQEAGVNEQIPPDSRVFMSYTDLQGGVETQSGIVVKSNSLGADVIFPNPEPLLPWMQTDVGNPVEDANGNVLGVTLGSENENLPEMSRVLGFGYTTGDWARDNVDDPQYYTRMVVRIINQETPFNHN